MLAGSQVSTHSPNLLDILEGETVIFISFLSTINLVCVTTDTMSVKVARGNSRDEPTKFMFQCQTKGCSRALHSIFRCDQHQVNCEPSGNSAIAVHTNDHPIGLLNVPNDSLDSTNEIEHDHAQSDTTESKTAVTTKLPRKRKRHISRADPDFPKQCPEHDTCKVTKTFANPDLL